MITLKLDQVLKEKGISQRELSRQTGIRQPTISEMCLNTSKTLSLKNLDKICNILDCDPSEIIIHKKEHSE